MVSMTAFGRLTKDATTFTYGDGKEGINFSIACNKKFGGDEATFVNCVKFGVGDNLAQYLTMGNQILVTGEYTVEESDGVYYSKLIVDQLEFGAKKG